MIRRSLALSILLPFAVLGVSALLNGAAKPSRASQDPIVVNKTRGCEIEARIIGNDISITLKNNHNKTITAYSIGLGNNHRITADFAYGVLSGIAPQDVYQRSYPLPRSVPTLYLETVVLENGGEDGDPILARRIKEERLGNKIQIYRALKILEKHDKKPTDLKTLKSEVAAALDTPEVEILLTLNELQSMYPVSSNHHLSEDVKAGLHSGGESVLRRLDELQTLPSEWAGEGWVKLKTRFREVLARL